MPPCRRPDRDRFKRPYKHGVAGRELVIKQAAFKSEGFASTGALRSPGGVWGNGHCRSA